MKGGGSEMKLPNAIKPSEILAYAEKHMKPEDIDHHGLGHGLDDLYLRVNPISRELVNHLTTKVLVGIFVDNVDGDLWYELPFCYNR